jgi:hypothetical protein
MVPSHCLQSKASGDSTFPSSLAGFPNNIVSVPLLSGALVHPERKIDIMITIIKAFLNDLNM